MKLEDKCFLITGGSAGIGRALAQQLAEQAAEVIIIGRNADALARVARTVPGFIHPLVADLAQQSEVERLIADLPGLFPNLAVVINNAGVQNLTDFTRDQRSEVRQILRTETEINFQAVIALCHGLLPHLAARPEAAIINITSGLALAPKTSAPVYCATKAGIRAFTRALRYQCEAAMPQVRVIEALPPIVDTAMTAGRGRGKISANACAAEILSGLRAGKTEIYIGKSKLLRVIMRLTPRLGYAIMRKG